MKLGILLCTMALLANSSFIGSYLPVGEEGSEGGTPTSPAWVMSVESVEGQVSMQPSELQGTDQWRDAEINFVLTAGGTIATLEQGRARLRIDGGLLSLPPNTTLHVQRLDDGKMLFQLKQGGVNVRIDHLPSGREIEVATGNGSLDIKAPGRYQFVGDAGGNLKTISVKRGHCLAQLQPNSVFEVEGGQQADISGSTYTLNTPEPTPHPQPELRADLTPGNPPPGNPSPNNPHQDNPSARPQYQPGNQTDSTQPGNPGAPPDDGSGLGPDTGQDPNQDPNQYPRQGPNFGENNDPGIENLAGYGDWRQSPGLEMAWYPHVDAGWAPFSVGHWLWVDSFGWTWVDQAPWGFTCSHYGRWGRSGAGWYWTPGPRIYSPAVVAWVTLSNSNVAWIPLGPREFAGDYPVSRYANRAYLSAVSRDTLVAGVAVRSARLHLAESSYAGMRTGGYLSVQPTVASIAGARPFAPHPQGFVLNRTSFARIDPGPPAISFQQRQRLWAGSQGRPIASRNLYDSSRANTQFRAPIGPATRLVPVNGMSGLRPGPGGNRAGFPAGVQPGQRPGSQTGYPQGRQPGQPGYQPGNQPGRQPGNAPGRPQPGTQPVPRQYPRPVPGTVPRPGPQSTPRPQVPGGNAPRSAPASRPQPASRPAPAPASHKK